MVVLFTQTASPYSLFLLKSFGLSCQSDVFALVSLWQVVLFGASFHLEIKLYEFNHKTVTIPG